MGAYAMKYTLIIISLIFLAPVSQGQTPSPQELEDWFNSEDFLPPQIKVNDGNLVFLKKEPAKLPLHAQIEFLLDKKSISDGWVRARQCYKNLDAMSESQILYGYKSMRNLKIISTRNIEKAFVQGQSVQLINAQRPASVCTEAEVQNFYPRQDNRFVLTNGPYHRRFLDGYFPFRLSMKIKYSDGLQFVTSRPARQPGFELTLNDNEIILETLFEGRLKTEFEFKALQQLVGFRIESVE